MASFTSIILAGVIKYGLMVKIGELLAKDMAKHAGRALIKYFGGNIVTNAFKFTMSYDLYRTRGLVTVGGPIAQTAYRYKNFVFKAFFNKDKKEFYNSGKTKYKGGWWTVGKPF